MMNKYVLKPVVQCWVSHPQFGQGLVLKVYEGLDGITLKVKWRDTEHGATQISQGQVSSGYKVGMEVQHVPVLNTQKSLGEGQIIKTRTISGYDQVLVYFPSSGINRWLPYQRCRWIKGVKHRFVTKDYGDVNESERFRLKFLAHAIETWNENTGSLSRLDIDPLPHQVHLVHHILASGHLNWLIADDVGLGKTIETGMLLKALEQRGQAKRVLLITPAGLKVQWKEELHNKFRLSDFRIYGQDFTIHEEREWGMYNHVIGSIDQFKEPQHLEKLLRADPWDIVIFDEAHRLSRRQYGLKFDASQRYQLAAQLRERTNAMVLLTATPHQGMQDKFQSLLLLLNPDKAQDIQRISINPEVLSEMMIRNNKSDVTDIDGNFIFKGKTTRAVKVTNDDASQCFEHSLKQYIKQGYATASELGYTGNAIGFVMTVYRKLAASSAFAIHRALKNRRLKLIQEKFGDANVQMNVTDERFEGEFEESELENIDNSEFFEGELEQLDHLLEESEAVLQKDNKLHEVIHSLIPNILANNENEKVLIFTEYCSTQMYLKEALENKFGRNKVSLINGSMSHQLRQDAINQFEDHGQFLISTEAGGEGINLQRHCHIMINYDLPWNPMRLVQRIGRLYRYGQQKRVVVFNLFSPASMDDEIIDLMHVRIDQVVKDLYNVSDEYDERMSEDITGEIIEMLDVEEILNQAVHEDITRTEDRIENALEMAKNAVNKQRELFEYATSYDASEIKEELNMTQAHVESFVLGMFNYLDVEIIERVIQDKVFKIKLPEHLCDSLKVKRSRWEITFDRDIYTRRKDCEMMDLDNFIFKHLIKVAQSYEFGGLSSAISINDDTQSIVCGYLRWMNTQGQRQRQELVAASVSKNARISFNQDSFSQWLIAPKVGSATHTDLNAKAIFEQAENALNDRLANKSNVLLHPDSIEHLCSAIAI